MGNGYRWLHAPRTSLSRKRLIRDSGPSHKARQRPRQARLEAIGDMLDRAETLRCRAERPQLLRDQARNIGGSGAHICGF
jgi:hypothetical protein